MTGRAELSHEQIRVDAARLGFTFCGVVRAEPSPTLGAYLRWVEAGMHGTMAYMARPDRIARRRDLGVILPGARSVAVVGLDYRTAAVARDVLNEPTRGRIAAYAWGADYHTVMGARLKALAEGLAGTHKPYVDTGAVLERSHAQQAGFGFIGKNTMLIHPRHGSTFFLGEIVTDAEFDQYDRPIEAAPTCGTCTRCLNACPTEAFPRPHVLDARRCISYHTIENKGAIPEDLRANFGNWVFGCDVCQDVCPFQRFAPVTPETAFLPTSAERAAPPLDWLLTMDDAAFHERFSGSAVVRAGRARLTRNACVAAGNSGEVALIPLLERLAVGGDEIVRAHAAWAINRLARPGG
ncbi:MAG: tRNA epoxyqueuosine(34) reductase QueG [Chloroflexi bacterium]|nr:tRNA epoxyqueuosine(34) reductase QueG [Chloroflexota bacterium]